LVRSILNGHHQIQLAGETHYFEDLRTKLGPFATQPLSDQRLLQCQDYFLALAHRPYGHHGDPNQSRLDRTQLARMATEIGGGGDAYFEAYCRLEADSAGATIWGEKTPRHVFCIAEMLALYPTARVICLVRDPRAVVASYRDWKNQGGFDFDADPGHQESLQVEQARTRKSYHPLIIATLWKLAMRASRQALDRFGPERIRLVKYEQVARDGEVAIAALADWLGIEFEPAMTEVPMHNSSFQTYAKTAGISATPIDRWRELLAPSELGAIELCCRAEMIEFGYERHSSFAATVAASRYWGTLPLAVWRAGRANRDRMGNFSAYVLRRLGVPRVSR
jgi:hypothetical protein